MLSFPDRASAARWVDAVSVVGPRARAAAALPADERMPQDVRLSRQRRPVASVAVRAGSAHASDDEQEADESLHAPNPRPGASGHATSAPAAAAAADDTALGAALLAELRTRSREEAAAAAPGAAEGDRHAARAAPPVPSLALPKATAADMLSALRYAAVASGAASVAVDEPVSPRPRKVAAVGPAGRGRRRAS